ncbi:tryptophan aminotransferase-related protein 3-like protein, partial [Tanacetum coccineum]
STKAVAEAEMVAAMSCFGNGKAFLDDPVYEGGPIYECYGYYGGLGCSELNPGCAVDANMYIFNNIYLCFHVEFISVSKWNF